MARARKTVWCHTNDGKSILGALCNIFEADGVTPAANVFLQAEGGTAVTSFVSSATDGTKTLYSDTEKFVTIEVTDNGDTATYAGAAGARSFPSYTIENVPLEAPPAEVMQLDGTQTVSGAKTFSGAVNVTGSLEVPEYAFAALPTSGVAAGQVVRVTDGIKGIWVYTGFTWKRLHKEARPEDFGATGTVDDSAVINAASAAAVLAGVPLLFQDMYTVASAVTPSSGSHWVGVGAQRVGGAWQPGTQGKIVGPGGAGNAGVHLSSVNNVRVQNMTLIGLLKIQSSYAWEFDHVGIDAGAAQHCFDIDNSFTGDFVDCLFVGDPPTPEVQTVTVTAATGGTFTLTFTNPHDGVVSTTAPIAYNATAADVQTALEALPAMGGTKADGTALSSANHITVTGNAGGPYTVKFSKFQFGAEKGQFSGINVGQMTADGALLTGSTPTVTVATTTPGSLTRAGRMHTTSGENLFTINFIRCDWWYSGVQWDGPTAANAVVYGDVVFISNYMENVGGRGSLLHLRSTHTTGTWSVTGGVLLIGCGRYDATANSGPWVTAEATAGPTNALTIAGLGVVCAPTENNMADFANASSTPNRVRLHSLRFPLKDGAVSYYSGWSAGNIWEIHSTGQKWRADNSTREVLNIGVFSEAYDRLRAKADGSLEWSPGTGPSDTNLYRSAADNLKTDDSFNAKRFLVPAGTTLTSADFALSAGWGDSASIAFVGTPKDQRYIISITANGAGIAASPTFTHTFKDGAFGNPVAVVSPYGSGALTTARVVQSIGATSLQILFNGTPVAGTTYSFAVMVMG